MAISCFLKCVPQVFATEWVLSLLKQLGQKQPAFTQSMYIVKPPFIGGKVAVHVDSTFLDTDPPSVIGLWVALEAATTDNGCLHILPGSHKELVTRRFKRTGGSVSLEGAMPESFDESNPRWCPCPVAAGDLIILHGGVAHMSHANTSAISRHAYSAHSIDMSCNWSSTNWIQRPSHDPLLPLEQWLASKK
jgi:phytanoyl-CoA hydroxylase